MSELVNIQEVCESKVTKTEMVEMVLADQELRIDDEIAHLLKSIPSKQEVDAAYNEFQDALMDCFKTKHKAIAAIAKKVTEDVNVFSHFVPVNKTTAARNADEQIQLIFKTPIRKPNSNNYSSGGTDTGRGYSLKSFYMDDHFKASCKRNTGNFTVVLPASSAKITAVKKKIRKMADQHEAIVIRIEELRQQKQQLAKTTKAIKSKLTRSLLESTPEGRAMIKQLDSIKGRVLGNLMLS